MAVFATARKIGTVVYRLLRYGQPYVDMGAEAMEKQYLQQRIGSVRSNADQLGFDLTPRTAAA